MSSLYAQYIKERQGIEIIECEEGFITYHIDSERCRIIDIFVAQEFRKKGYGMRLALQVAEIAREAKCRIVLGQVDTRALNCTDSLSAMLKMGMRVLCNDGDLIMLVRDL